jgi:Domain of unknown function (DUF1707)
VNEVPSPQLRISDLDREAALQALGEHMSVGRIDLDEYGDRSANVTSAKTRGELVKIFADLPQPHPQFGAAPPPEGATATSTEVQPAAVPGQPTSWAERPLHQRLTAAAVPLAWLAGLALMLTVGGWWWFIIPMAFTGAGRQLWGRGWAGDHHDRHHERHEAIRDRRDYRDDRRDRRRR